MKYIASPLIALAFAATAISAPAQNAGSASPDQQAVPPAQQPGGAPPPANPAPDTSAAPPSASAPAPAQPSGAVPPPSSAPGASATQVSDTEVDQFAKATVKVQAINTDAKLDATAKQKQMADAVKASGLDPARYNEIAKAIPTDDALRAKVQTAMAKYASPPKG